QHLEKVGMHGISNELGIRILSDILLYQSQGTKLGEYPVIACQSFNWNAYMRHLYFNSNYPSFFNDVVASMQTGVESSCGIDFRGMSKEDVYSYVKESVHNIVEQIIGIQSSTLDLDTPFSELGMDSLSAIELRNALITRFGIKISPTALFDYPTIRSIMEYLTDSLYISETQDRIDEIGLSCSERSSSIAIIGVSCRLPGGVKSINDLYQNILLWSKDCITEIPLDRWPYDVYYDPDPDNRSKSYVNQGAFTTDIDLFDNTFFGLSSTEATNVDPQQKYMLEVAYEAMYNCGITKRSLSCNKKSIKTGKEDPLLTGVFIGCCNVDWHFLQAKFGFENFTSYTGSGGASSLVSNRVSYSFGFRGPSQTVDTACSSSLVAMDAALKSLKEGSCHTALVGGVNLMLSPHLFVAFCRARMLSPDCRCKTFDAAANGYVRGEGCGAILITKRTEIDGKKIKPIAFVLGSATNHNGRSASLTAPNGPSQTEVIQSALRNANIDPFEIDYLESHGTGTPLGDPIEFGALKTVFGNRKDIKRKHPLILGALKTNIGHLEGAAGVSGLLKLILVLKHRIAPKILHFQKLNPHIDPEDFDVEFPLEIKTINSNKPKLAGGVSSFGFGGCNSHVILESVSPEELNTESESTKNNPYLIFAYTGQGCQYINMCKALYETEIVFRNEMNNCDKLLYPILGRSIISAIYCDKTTEAENLINNTSISQPAIFSIEYSLTKLWESNGIIPSAVMGHSLGEFAAAVTSGILSLENAITLVAKRAEIMASLPKNDGIMVACRVSEGQVLKSIEELGLRDSAAVAAINGPKSITISGSKSSVFKILTHIGMEERYKQLDVSHAFHSPLVSFAEHQFEKVIENTHFSEPNITFISSVTGEIETKLLIEKKYWAQHILHSVRYYDALETVTSLDKENIAIIEVGPRSVLTTMGKQAIGGVQLTSVSAENIQNNDIVWIPTIESSKPSESDFNLALKAVRDYEEFISLNTAVHKWNHSRFHWADLTSVHPLLGKFHSSISDEDYLAYSTDMLKSEVFKEIVEDHVIFNTNIVPAAALIEASACAAFKLQRTEKFPSKYVEMISMDIEKPLVPNQDETTSEMEVFVSKSGAIQIRKKCISESFEYEEEFTGPRIIANDAVFNNSRIYHHASVSSTKVITREEVYSTKIPSLDDYLEKYSQNDIVEVPINNIYEMMNEIGLQYKENYQCLSSVKIKYKGNEQNITEESEKSTPDDRINEVFCFVKRPKSDFDLTELRIHPTASVLFAGELLIDKDISTNKRGHVAMAPIGFNKCYYGRVQHNSDVWGLVKLNKFEKTGEIAFLDVTLWDSNTNHVAAHFQDLILKGFSNAASLLSQEVRIPNQLLWKTYNKQIIEDPDFTNESSNSLIEVNKKVLIFGIPGSIKNLIFETIGNTRSNITFKYICIEDNLTVDLIDKSIQEDSWSAIFYLGGLANILSTKQVMGDILMISQVISNLAVSISIAPFICLGLIDENRETMTVPKHSGIKGFVKTARVELENVVGKSINISLMECDPRIVSDPKTMINTIFYITSLFDDKNEVISLERDLIITETGIFAPRLESINFQVVGAMKLSMSSRGAINNLKFKPQSISERVCPPANTVEIR
ncbi:putative type I fatty acid synthase, partial [Cryptosporidium felis]